MSTTLTRLTDSCIQVTDEQGVTIIDPGSHTWSSGEFDLDGLGEVQRVLITHQHGDHMNPEFIRWLVDRGADVRVFGNDAVAGLLAEHDLEVLTDSPDGVTVQDTPHEPLPDGSTPPNRSWTLSERFTHIGDSFGAAAVAPVVTVPLVTPFSHPRLALDFAARVQPRQVLPVHDFYLTANGREMMWNITGPQFEKAGVELLRLGWGESLTLD